MNLEERRQYGRNHYAANKDVYKKRALERNARMSADMVSWLADLKSSVPCSDCGNKFPHVAMDFDHVSGEKIMSVARLARQAPSWVRLFAEILKCEIVCANCHRVRTNDRLNA